MVLKPFKPIAMNRLLRLVAFTILATGITTTFAAQPAAQPAQSPAPATGKAKTDELSEVVVSAEKPTRKPSVLIDWIRRLLGQYTVEGKVDLGGKGNPQDRWTAAGTGECIGFGVAPGVQCELTIKWPQIPGPHGQEVLSGVSDLAPAMILYGVEPDELGIRYLLVNNKGLAEGSTGFIINDTGTFKTPCVNAPPGCQRVIKITAPLESKILEMQIDTEVNAELAARFNFKFRRVGQPQAEMASKPSEKGAAPAVPATPAGKTPAKPAPPAPAKKPADKK